ncbi:hypothetical protein MLD38_008021 [Melastoma candidum]|uniref:Uncharacterized protein n=1 Tax=Melastoma candidum TaxID=119954 RepID=A0ACB9RS50_9MYRT|nr:hypothetical protein MLD38_008021 [Melastoma candidum]
MRPGSALPWKSLSSQSLGRALDSLPSRSNRLMEGKSKQEDASPTMALAAQLICGITLVGTYVVAPSALSTDLVSDPTRTLRLFWLTLVPVVVILFGLFRQNRGRTSLLRAVGRGLLALPAGAIVNALGAVVLGAPVHVKYLPGTVEWSLMMSTMNFVPAASVFGASWSNWQRIFAFTKPNSWIDIMICVPAHGAVVGAWFGAWPMPLDWDRPWQEWPICVSYGAITGYLVGLAASCSYILLRSRHQWHVKSE